MIVAASGKVTRLTADEIPAQGRRTLGRLLVRLESGDRVVEVTRAHGVGTVGRGGENGAAGPLETEEDQLDLL